MNKANCIKNAKAIRSAATNYLHSSLSMFSDDAEMKKTVREDAADLREVAKLLRAGRVDEACHKADCLDTLVRDVIPHEPWNFMHGRERSALSF